MKPRQHITPVGAQTTFIEVWRWGQELERLHARIAPRFARPEPRRRTLAYLKGIVGSVERKNGWKPGRTRRRKSSRWDATVTQQRGLGRRPGARRVSRAYILEHLGDPQAVLVIDAHELRASVATSQQGWPGSTAARRATWKIGRRGVFLAYASVKGHTLLDRELYLPMRWIKERKRCQEAGIPDTVRFQTKCEQARQMIERLWQAKVPFAWVVADTVYGGNEDLRTWLEAHGYSFVLAVACDEPVEIQTRGASQTDDGGPGRSLLLPRGGVAAALDESRHQGATTVRLGRDADAPAMRR